MQRTPNDLWVDLETRSRVDLKKSGARRYAADPSTNITWAVWYFQGTMKTACPVHPSLGTHSLFDLFMDIADAVEKGGRIVAHHANFDVTVIAGQNRNFYVPVQRISCTMARAQCLSLPGGLEELCMALNVAGKDPRGRALVMQTCKPQRDGTFCEDLQVFRELGEYAVQDVRCLMTVDGLLPELSDHERPIFERTWRKNEIGLPVDIELAQAIALRRQQIEHEAEMEVREITGNTVTKLSQRQRIVQWANGWLPSTKKHEVAEALENPELPWQVRALCELLQESGGSAPTKAQALLDRQVGGFYKDGTRYFGTRSGRGTSEGANMFNVARPSGKYKPEEVIIGLKAGFAYDNTALTDALRGCIVAVPGYKLVDEDLANAELRLALWQAGDTERLNILAGGGDLYMYNAIPIFGLPADATKDTHPKERQSGKNITLGGNYQLGWKTYMAYMRKNGTPIPEQRAKDDIFGYRRSNPLLTGLWDTLKNAFWNCLYEPPGRYFPAGKVSFIKDGTTIWCVLPSGRAVPHYSAFVGDDGNMGFFRAKFGAMLPQKVFGGSLLEITCQSMTRDLITAAEQDIENELPDVILGLDIYDSIVAFAPEKVAEERAHQIAQIMSRPRSWTAGLPINAEGYVHTRMKK
jgi:DNA polymerase bacteriophage-type